MTLSLHEKITKRATKDPNGCAFIACAPDGTTTKSLTNAELLREIETAASYLIGLGLRPGDRIALSLSNSPELLILSWAAWSMGIVTVPLDLKRDTDELREYKVRVSGASRTLTGYEKTMGDLPSWMPGIDHDALILFTSGTTAYPKGAVLTLKNLLVNAEAVAKWLHIESQDRFLVCLPLHHINSTTFCLATLIAEGSIAVPPLYSNSHFWEQAAKTGATITSIVQSIVYDQLRQKDMFEKVKGELKLSRIQIGSAPVLAESVETFIKEFHIPLYQGYGQTETALRVTGVPMELPREIYKELVRENSIGAALPWATLEIVDTAGTLVGEGQEGELIVTGDAVMRGYVGGEPAFRNGYFLTGDVGFYRTIDGTRYFFLKGRKKEIIIKGGVNISPVSVENALLKISSDIDQAYVIGFPDPRYGEEVAAVLCFRAGVEKKRALERLKATLLFEHQALSTYETPHVVAVVSQEELPTTSTGKVQRIKLKEELGVERFEPTQDLLATDTYTFKLIDFQSLYAEQSRLLYNHSWQPLSQSKEAYKEFLKKNYTIIAVDHADAIAGQISFTIQDRVLTCVSICSATFSPKPIPKKSLSPSPALVEKYLQEGHDPVMNFHAKLGGKLVEVVPGGRPEDKSSCGYTLLVSYPKAEPIVTDGPVSVQLIALIRQIAADLHYEVYALSRPGGLARYLSKDVV